MKKDFIYANGRISGEDMTILSTRMWQMLVSARDLEEALRLLTDTWYGGFMQGHELGNCFEQAIRRDVEARYRAFFDEHGPGCMYGVMGMCPPEPVEPECRQGICANRHRPHW